MLASTLQCANAPGSRPASTLAKLISRMAMPPWFMMLPARMKKGMASSVKLSSPEAICWATIKTDCSTPMNSRKVSVAAEPMAKAMGTPMAMKMTKEPKRTQIA